MRVDLTEQEGQMLAVVLNNVVDALKQLEGDQNKGPIILQSLKGGEDLIVRLKEQLPHLEMSVRESRFLREILQVIRQNVSEESKENFLSNLEDKLAMITLPLTHEQRMTLSLILGIIAEQLQGLSAKGDAEASVKTALRILGDVRSRLERLELTDREASVLKNLLKSVKNSIEKNSEGMLEELENKLGANCQVSVGDRQALGIILEQLIPALKIEFERDASEKARAAVAVTELILLNTQNMLRSFVMSRVEAKLIVSVLALLSASMNAQLSTLKANVDAVLQLQALVEMA